MAIKTNKATAFKRIPRIPKSRNTPGQMVIPTMSALEPNKKTREDHELFEQKELFKHLRGWARTHPKLGWVHSIPNGLPLHSKVSQDAVASGLTSGVWDCFAPFVRQGWPGLYVEMKWGKNKLTTEQEAFKENLIEEGYKYEVCYSWLAAARVIVDYLEIVDPWIEQVLEMNVKGKPAKT